MSEGSLRIIDTHADHFYQTDHNWNVARSLTMSYRQYLEENICHITEAVAEEIGACLESPQGTNSDLQWTYSALKLWYQHVKGRQPHPFWTDLEKVLGDYADLYQREEPPPPGRPFPNHINSFNIDDETPSKLEIEATVRCLRRNREGIHTHL